MDVSLAGVNVDGTLSEVHGCNGERFVAPGYDYPSAWTHLFGTCPFFICLYVVVVNAMDMLRVRLTTPGMQGRCPTSLSKKMVVKVRNIRQYKLPKA